MTGRILILRLGSYALSGFDQRGGRPLGDRDHRRSRSLRDRVARCEIAYCAYAVHSTMRDATIHKSMKRLILST